MALLTIPTQPAVCPQNTGSIIVANSLGCVTANGQPWRKILRERVVTEPAIQHVLPKSETVKVTLLTSAAGFHECFKHAYIEYYHGKPSKLDAARNARKESLATKGLEVPWDGFASTQSVLAKAQVSS